MCVALTLQLEKFCAVFEMASLWGMDLENLLLPLPLRLVDLANVPTIELMIIAFGTLTQRVLKGVGSNGEDLPAEYKHAQKESSNTHNDKHKHNDAAPRIRCTACSMCGREGLSRKSCPYRMCPRPQASARSLPARSMLG